MCLFPVKVYLVIKKTSHPAVKLNLSMIFKLSVVLITPRKVSAEEATQISMPKYMNTLNIE